ncbi:MAG: c-type cytochrome [Bdellovibrionales bacterium]|nr:c-type cytochrome [Bdellovibrionales bacterium]
MIRTLVKLVSYQLLLIIGLVIFTGCSDDNKHQPLLPIAEPTGGGGGNGSGSGSELGETNEGPTFADVQPLLEQKCAACHKWHSTDKDKFIDLAKKGRVKELIWDKKGVNPAMASAINASLTDEDRKLIKDFSEALLHPTSSIAKKSNAIQPQNCPDPGTVKTQVQATPSLLDQLSDVEVSNTISSCTSCHGVEGINQKSGVPHLAGLKKEYILAQLHGFKQVKISAQGEIQINNPDNYPEGARQDSNTLLDRHMNRTTQNMSEAQMELVAEYFSALPVFSAGANEDNQGRFNNCIGCHNGQPSGFGPRIQGQKAEYIASQLRAFKSGQRVNAIMSGQVVSITDDEIDDLANYISQLKVQ